ncbi:MAG: hypothetical protein JO327_02170 [Nitrososphaeraceae archaeon]|nr:hypothetical protein [Nitrososphaeraceae archaeon]MBV9666917.1 hypothetical protein [Nitrososphaeraceae archaeon]
MDHNYLSVGIDGEKIGMKKLLVLGFLLTSYIYSSRRIYKNFKFFIEPHENSRRFVDDEVMLKEHFV